MLAFQGSKIMRLRLSFLRTPYHNVPILARLYFLLR